MRTFTLLLKKVDVRFEAVVDKLCPLFTTSYYHQTNYKEAKYGFPAALVHGDLWAPNILWKTDENGQATSELSAVIDWQSVHAGNPLEDFGRLLVLNTTSAYRRANHDRLLKLYISKLREYGNGESPIHEGNITEAYKAALPYVALFFGFGVPMYLNMPSVVRQDPEHKPADSAELLDRTLCFFEEVVEAYAL
uniref:CHK domain-containing protein n=1 Tax=Steinernema glaseri TaxID=37863 RepID=A0A1I8ALL2_9BILA